MTVIDVLNALPNPFIGVNLPPKLAKAKIIGPYSPWPKQIDEDGPVVILPSKSIKRKPRK